jgi:hypothetical protein
MTINLEQLSRANRHVTDELDQLGLRSSRMAQVDVWLVPFSWDCFGWQEYGTDGSICIPQVGLARLGPYIPYWGWSGYTLRDVLRHEWAHALAFHHHDLVSRKSFERAFDGGHDSGDSFQFDPEIHITEYATTDPSEDFAENFMHYVQCRGVLPKKWQTPSINKRWQFITGLRSKVGHL